MFEMAYDQAVLICSFHPAERQKERENYPFLCVFYRSPLLGLKFSSCGEYFPSSVVQISSFYALVLDQIPSIPTRTPSRWPPTHNSMAGRRWEASWFPHQHILLTQLTRLIHEFCRCHLFVMGRPYSKPSASFLKPVDTIELVLLDSILSSHLLEE